MFVPMWVVWTFAVMTVASMVLSFCYQYERDRANRWKGISKRLEQVIQRDRLLYMAEARPRASASVRGKIVHQFTVTQDGARPRASASVRDLAGYWPDMPDLEDGVDRFAEYPIAGAPTE